MLMSALITPTPALFYVGNPEENLLFLYKEDFSWFFLEPFPWAITTAAIITATATPITTIAAIAATAISVTPIKVKVFPFKETL